MPVQQDEEGLRRRVLLEHGRARRVAHRLGLLEQAVDLLRREPGEQRKVCHEGSVDAGHALPSTKRAADAAATPHRWIGGSPGTTAEPSVPFARPGSSRPRVTGCPWTGSLARCG